MMACQGPAGRAVSWCASNERDNKRQNDSAAVACCLVVLLTLTKYKVQAHQLEAIELDKLTNKLGRAGSCACWRLNDARGWPARNKRTSVGVSRGRQSEGEGATCQLSDCRLVLTHQSGWVHVQLLSARRLLTDRHENADNQASAFYLSPLRGSVCLMQFDLKQQNIAALARWSSSCLHQKVS